MPGSGPQTLGLAPPQFPRVPPELLPHIFRLVKCRSTLATASRVCRVFQSEAERILYDQFSIQQTFQLQSLHYALSKAPRRALAIRRLTIIDFEDLSKHTGEIAEILLALTNLRHLTVIIVDRDSALYRSILCVLNRCTFALDAFEGTIQLGDDIVQFFRQQSSISLLDVYSPGRRRESSGWEFPPDVLPRLQYLRTPCWDMPAFRSPRMVTHLDLTERITNEDELFEVLPPYRNQLVSLKYSRYYRNSDGPVFAPSHMLRLLAFPNLKCLDISEQIYYEACIFLGLATLGTGIDLHQ